ncbi:MAG: ABC transporter ATP-binding protein [Fusobacteriaceae bacterium]|jgi:NitT/TauT family transport system ATP-binding protein/sulfonate transport system ATP-binding protein|nr:ABC transporter ATP-binding protein [Fusobacteriaceae bacterium]
MNLNAIDIRNVSQRFTGVAGEEVNVLRDINLQIRKGEFLSIIGPSGCGKTTLLRLIAGLASPLGGTLTEGDAPITGPSPDRGYVFQQNGLFPWLTVEKNIAAGLKARKVYAKEKRHVKKYIELVGLSGFEGAYPHQISGGMAQRAAIARSLINEPTVLLLDEPLGALDSFTRMNLQEELLRLWRDKGNTMIMVTHDIDEAVYLSNRIVVMTPRPGQIAKIIDVPMGYPRNRASADFTRLRTQILTFLNYAHETQPEYAL